MFKNIKQIYFTLIYLKPIQIRYQIFYRFKKHFNLFKTNKIEFIRYDFIKIDFLAYKNIVISKNKYENKNTFTFLGLTYFFNNKINWNYNSFGKLWNYNLQYFDYLLDNSIEIHHRIALLEDFSINLKNGTVKLEPYPVSIRIINTIIFLSENKIHNEEIEKVLSIQVTYLKNNLEYHLLGNHLLENIFSLFIASNFYNNKKLNKLSLKLLEEQLEEQILKDGAHFECSPMYHNIILSKLLLCIEVAQKNKFFDINIDFLISKAGEMKNWINKYSFPDGSWALMNDAALYIAPTTIQINSACELLKINNVDKELKESGYRKLSGDNWECIIKVGNITPSYQPGHTHSDMLSYCLWYKGNHIVVDPGVSTYENNHQRLNERGTSYHNTVTINKQNQSDVWGSFRIGKRANCIILKDSCREIVAIHDGFNNRKTTHKRSFISEKNTLIIIDEVKSNVENSIKFESKILFNDDFQFDFTQNTIKSKQIQINFNSPGQISDDYFANSYNRLKSSKSIKFSPIDSIITNYIFN